MARHKYTATFPAAKAGEEVTWPSSVKVYPDANNPQPLTNGYIESVGGSFVGWSDAVSVTFTRAGTSDAVTVTSGSPTGTGAAVGGGSAASGPSQGTSIGVASVVDANTVRIAYTSPWGIDADGNPYYIDGGNAVDGEAAILCVNPATGNFAVVRPDGAVAV